MIVNATPKTRFFRVLLACAYVLGSEVLLRMTHGNFFYEIAKYLVIVFVLLGMLFEGFKMKALPYFLYILLLVPGIFVLGTSVSYDTNIRTAIAFNLSGPICLGVSALYCYDKPITFKNLKTVLFYAALPLISTTCYLVLFTPSVRDVVTGTFSNFATSGGYGPNQVATVLGLGMFIMTTRFFLDSKGLMLKILNLALLGFVAYRGVVTFSRGGIITGVVIIIAFLGIYYISSVKVNRPRIVKYIALLFGAFLVLWVITSIQTRGFIDKRYANQDAAGRSKDDLTTGRTDLVSFEFYEFIKHPFFGVGVGKVKELRIQKEGEEAASHNEVSRIFAEHGLFGVVALLLLLFVPLFYRLKNRRNIFFYSFYLFWFLTINHSAMRIAAPAFIYAMTLLNVKHKSIEKASIHRKPSVSKG